MGIDFIHAPHQNLEEMAAVMQKIMIKTNNHKIAILALRKVPLIGAATIKKLWQKEYLEQEQKLSLARQEWEAEELENQMKLDKINFSYLS